jgi:sterol desaturase/sphingolipid hydroxylase (fatty acid hydroxylase superfamily)
MEEFLTAHQHALAYLKQLASSAVSLVMILAIFTPLEAAFAVRKSKLFYKGWSVNLGWYFVNALASVILLGPPTALIAWAVHTVLPAGFTQITAALPLWARMVLAMIVGEFGFYWSHRWSHEWPLLWRFHAVHHSAEHVGFLVNTRAHPIDLVFGRLLGLFLLYATGLATTVGPHPTLVPALVLFVGSMWSFFIHANIRWRLGVFEEVLSTPAFHHWHHTREDHKDHNYASMLPIYDRIFGTFHLPKTWPVDYGTDTYMPATVTGQLIEPFAPARPRQGARTQEPTAVGES